ncbi:MAG: class II aldolase/adducin family protein [Burkholderiaceae bacterium]|jgi:ribulose-5-phosphate 4-epimerase/fuculose-1-phosphate aldolase|nr:class II aldolase/adducin family protein [Burkholderiales bacterium]MCZ8105499.1 class II aldolase/adducin family protein [Burkholderiales bacterium]MCZ8340092.1 class II aldolase/adducin family protein [Burkholderiaceae bacterium]
MSVRPLREQVSDEEWRLRVDLAACYRLVALYGMSDLIFTHLTVKLPASVTGGTEHFLINPFGMLFEEITASSLIRIDRDGNPLTDSPLPVNRAGFVIHGAIHEARPEVACVLHTHTRAGVAVSARQDGLLPLSQQATLVMGSLAYHDYEGIAVRDDERARLQRDLGAHDCMILRNHGLLTVGMTIADAFWRMYTLESACRIQVDAQHGGGRLVLVDRQIVDGVTEAVSAVSDAHPARLAWPALRRRLDEVSPGYDH